MEIGRAFGFMFEDKNWVTKILIGGALSLIPWIGLLFVFGYEVQLIRNIAKGIENPLPEWDNWQQKLIDGLMIFVLLMLFFLPVIVMIFIPCCGWLALIPYICTYAPLPYLLYAKYGDIGKALNIKEAWELLTTQFGNLFVIFLMQLVFMLIAFFGILACCIGVYFTMFWACLASAYLMGQLFKQIQAKQTVPV